MSDDGSDSEGRASFVDDLEELMGDIANDAGGHDGAAAAQQDDECSHQTVHINGRRVSLEGSPRPHQIAALQAYSHHAAEPRGQIIMACGSGKTLTAMWIALLKIRAQDIARIVVLFPNLLLVRQTWHEWVKHMPLANGDWSVLIVCSDKKTGEPPRAHGLPAAPLAPNRPRARVTSHSIVIADFLAGPGVRVVFCTYQSAGLLQAAQQLLMARGKPFVIDLGIFDEAHKTATKGNRMSFALHEANIRMNQRVFFTATPRIMDWHQGSSMDCLELYGDVWHELSFFSAAHEFGCIVPYTVLFVMVDVAGEDALTRKLDRIADDGPLVSPEDRPVTAREVAAIKAIVAAMTALEGCSKALTFHSYNPRAKRFVDYARALLQHMGEDIAVDRVDGVMNAAERADVLDKFQDAGKRIVASARCLQEGVDLPAIDLAVLVELRRSTIDLIQLIGRVVRKAPGKTCGYILVPVCVDSRTDNVVDAAGEFTTAVAMMRSLMECDSVLRSHMKRAKAEFADGKGEEQEPFVNFWEFPLFGKICAGVLRGHAGLNALWGRVAAKLFDLATDPWQDTFKRLDSFKTKYGHCCVTRVWSADRALGAWVANQRALGARGELCQNRRAQLDGIGFVWLARDAQWDECFSQLQLYCELHGNCNVPHTYDADPSFGNWVQKQRGQKNTMSADRRQRLESVGFRWASDWDQRFTELADFGRKNGGFQGLTTTNALGRWAKRQRTARNKFNAGYADAMPADQAKRLDEIGFA